MGADSTIEWTTHTFNPWRGCTKCSLGCKFCYAETLSARNPGVLGIWGPNGTRVVASESAWREPLKWDRKARAAGERHRVFCASLADVFEDWQKPMVGPDGKPIGAFGAGMPQWWVPWPAGLVHNYGAHPVAMGRVRQRLADLIRSTPNLDWLLLTKRPENAARMLIEMFGPDRSTWPANFRVGTSVENQATADERLPHLVSLDWPNFVSAEPLLGPIDLFQHLYKPCPRSLDGLYMDQTTGAYECCSQCDYTGISDGLAIDWIIVGGESGPNARPMNPTWVRSIRDQCQAASVPFLFKQMMEGKKKISLPELDGERWVEFPENPSKQGVFA